MLLVFFQESTAQAFANDRMIADGDVSAAIRLVRCLNKMESSFYRNWWLHSLLKNTQLNLP